MGRLFEIALRGKGKILFPQCNGGIFLLGGGNLTRIALVGGQRVGGGGGRGGG